MKSVELTSDELQMIKKARSNNYFKYPLTLKLNHKLLSKIANGVRSDSACHLITLMLANAQNIKGNLVAKLSLHEIYTCLGINHSKYRVTIIQNILNMLRNVISCGSLKHALKRQNIR